MESFKFYDKSSVVHLHLQNGKHLTFLIVQLHRVQSFLHKHVNKTLSNFEYLEEHQSTTKDFSPLLQPHDTGDGIA